MKLWCPKCNEFTDRYDCAVCLTAERDRLAAENAELWSSRPAETAYLDLSNRQLIIDYEQALKGLAAADATLDRLREVVPKVLPPHMSWKDSLDGARAILYPPETPSIRDTAAAHGFDAMPDDIAQRSVDGETNYVRLNQENKT